MSDVFLTGPFSVEEDLLLLAAVKAIQEETNLDPDKDHKFPWVRLRKTIPYRRLEYVRKR